MSKSVKQTLVWAIQINNQPVQAGDLYVSRSAARDDAKFLKRDYGQKAVVRRVKIEVIEGR